jgi:hypothetical protein
MAITDLVAAAIDVQALRASRSLFLQQTLSAPQLASLRDELTLTPILSTESEITNRVEYMLTLEDVMAVIRGDTQRYLAAQAGDFSRARKINLGNLPGTDWTVALRQMNQYFVEENTTNGLSFLEQCRKIENNARRAEILNTPGAPIFETNNVGVPAVEAFLKKRPKEAGAEYARRIGRWFLEGSPRGNLKFFRQLKMPEVEYNLTLLALQLEQYRLTHRAYPENLSVLGTDLPTDLFADAPFHYRRDQKGFTLWSVGVDGTDNNAAGDVLVAKSEK